MAFADDRGNDAQASIPDKSLLHLAQPAPPKPIPDSKQASYRWSAAGPFIYG